MKIFDKIFGSNSEDKPSIVTREPLLEKDIKSIDEYKTPQIDNERMERLKKIAVDNSLPSTSHNETIDPLNYYFQSNSNFSDKGYRDGEMTHDTNVKNTFIINIINDFTNYLDRHILELKNLRDNIKVKVSGLSNYKNIEKVNIKIVSLDDEIRRLEEQKTLASTGNGMIAKAISDYENGFERGVNRFMDTLLSDHYNVKDV